MDPMLQVAGLGPHQCGWSVVAGMEQQAPPSPWLISSLERQSGTCQRGQFTSIWKIKEIK